MPQSPSFAPNILGLDEEPDILPEMFPKNNNIIVIVVFGGGKGNRVKLQLLL